MVSEEVDHKLVVALLQLVDHLPLDREFLELRHFEGQTGYIG